jgi:hypothetical protein
MLMGSLAGHKSLLLPLSIGISGIRIDGQILVGYSKQDGKRKVSVTLKNNLLQGLSVR